MSAQDELFLKLKIWEIEIEIRGREKAVDKMVDKLMEKIEKAVPSLKEAWPEYQRVIHPLLQMMAKKKETGW